MKILAVLGGVLAVVLLLVGLFSYLVLPGLIESRLAANLQESFGLAEEPTVEVSSDFPPEMLLGRLDRIDVRINSFVREGIELRDLRIDLEGVDVSVLGLLSGNPDLAIGAVSLGAEVPEESINEYLRENDLGLEGGEIDIRPQDVAYQVVIFGVPASVVLDLRVLEPNDVEVIPQEATVGGYELPSFLTRPLASGGRTLHLSELPLEVELVSVETSEDDALIVRAET